MKKSLEISKNKKENLLQNIKKNIGNVGS